MMHKCAAATPHRLPQSVVKFPTVDDLLSTYTRLKETGIKSVLNANFDGTIAFYYLDLNGNCIKLSADRGDLRTDDARLEELAIEPVLSANHGATRAFYYLDCDGNCIKFPEGDSEQPIKAVANASTPRESFMHLMGAFFETTTRTYPLAHGGSPK
jgi:catechol-2,3-dioxygenase